MACAAENGLDRPDGTTAFAGAVRHVYVHVPFCRARCDYCDFASVPVGAPGEAAVGEPGEATTAAKGSAVGRAGAGGRAGAEAARQLDSFCDGVAAEWERERAAHGVRRLSTLYLGGGTPSLLGPDRLERLLERFRPYLTPHAEVTVEANPEDVDDGFASWAAAAPVAGGAGAGRGLRISLGVQSFSPAVRAALGRRAQADPAAAFARLRRAGAGNVGLDLIHGVPGQTRADLDGDIAAVLGLRPAHISWYELTIAAETPLGRRLAGAGADAASAGPAAGRVPLAATQLPSDDRRAEMYRRIVGALSRAGYDWYEVSNFALPGRKARHNLAYWRARPYIGLGPAAVSTVGGRRWTNAAEPGPWSAALAAGAGPPRTVEKLDPVSCAQERLLLAARCGVPVPLAEVAAAIDSDAAAQLAGAGLVSLHSDTIRVTRKGRHVANEVCVRLFRATRLRG